MVRRQRDRRLSSLAVKAADEAAFSAVFAALSLRIESAPASPHRVGVAACEMVAPHRPHDGSPQGKRLSWPCIRAMMHPMNAPPSIRPPPSARTIARAPARWRSRSRRTPSAACTAPRSRPTRRASSARRWRATPSACTIRTGCSPLRRVGPKGLGRSSSASPGTKRSTRSPRASCAPSASYGARERLALLLRRHDGPCACATASSGCATPRDIRGIHSTICINLAWTGYIAGPADARPDPREMAKSDCVVIWGTNAGRDPGQRDDPRDARRGRSAARRSSSSTSTATPPMKQADMRSACGPAPTARSPARSCTCCSAKARRPRLPRPLHRRSRTSSKRICRPARPEWAAAITGLSVEEIEAFARLVGTTKRSYFRLGYGFSRQRNGAANMHAATCIAAVTGAWQYEGGGAFHYNNGICQLDMR